MSTSRATLEDVCEFILDGTHGSPVRTETGIPVLSAQNVTGGRLEFETSRYTSQAEYDKYAKRLTTKKGDVLLTIVGTIGRTAILQSDERFVFQRSVAVLRPKLAVCDNRYLYHALGSDGAQRQLQQRTNQSSQAGVYLSKLKTLEIPLPPLDEQKRIAAVLDAADALRAKRRAALARLDTLLQSVFLEMFGDPVTNPMGWEVVKLGDIVSHVGSGATPRGGSSVYLSEGHLFIRSQNVLMFKFDFSDAAYIDETIHRSMQRSWVRNNDVLLNITGASIGRVNFFQGTDDSANVNQHVCIIRPSLREVLPAYLTYHLGAYSFQNKIIGQNSGATRQAFTFGQIKDFDIMLPPMGEQQGFEGIRIRVADLVNRAVDAFDHVERLFDSLQQSAFGGDLALQIGDK